MFDPYHKWLGIPKKYRPPTYYRLLGIEPDETDREVIDESAIRQSAHLRTYQIGEHADLCTRLLNEISQARTVLLDPAKRKKYDAHLAQRAAQKSAEEKANQRAGILTPALSSPTMEPPSAFAGIDDDSPIESPRQRRSVDRYRKKGPNYLLLGLAAGAALLVLLVAVPITVVAFFLLSSTSDTVNKGKAIAAANANNQAVKNPFFNPNPKPVNQGNPKPNPVNPNPKPKDNRQPNPQPKNDPQPKGVPNNPNQNPVEPMPAIYAPVMNLVDEPNRGARLANAREIYSISCGRNKSVLNALFLPKLNQVFIAGDQLEKYDTGKHRLVGTYNFPSGNGGTFYTILRLSADGKQVFLLHKGDKIIRIIDLATNRQAGRLVGHNNTIRSFELLPDGKHLVTLSRKTVRFWDIENRTDLFHTPPYTHSNWQLAVNPDGTKAWIAKSVRNTPTIEIWNLQRKKLERSMTFERQFTFSALAVSNDSRFAAAYSYGFPQKNGIVFGKAGDKELKYVSTQDRWQCIDFSSDGKLLLSSSLKSEFFAWNPQTCSRAVQFVGHKRQVNRTRFSSDGNRVISCGNDGCAKIWALP